ncbi:MAG: hypothetical protein LUQ22_00860 [Methanotrichaceae archaeon]|nr:hypothetical protein [Methanotrichaceae archaeon]
MKAEIIMALRGSRDLAEFILMNYSGKVVEVGAGNILDVALKLHSLEIVATDSQERLIGGMKVERDDIFSPMKEIYRGASLIYSIRPPIELQIAMGELALEIGADVLIRPLEDEVVDLHGFSKNLMNIGEARFYLFRHKYQPRFSPF